MAGIDGTTLSAGVPGTTVWVCDLELRYQKRKNEIKRKENIVSVTHQYMSHFPVRGLCYQTGMIDYLQVTQFIHTIQWYFSVFM